MTIGFILLLCAFITFLVRVILGLTNGSSGRLELIALGLALLVASMLVGVR